MKRIIILIIAFSLVITGSIDQKYVHKVYENGESRIDRNLDLSFFSSVLQKQSLQMMASECLKDDSLHCSLDVENMTIYTYHVFESNNLYYSIEIDNGLPYSTYTLTVLQVPNDQFTYDLRDIMARAGLETNSQEIMEPIDLREGSTWGTKAYALEALGVSIGYSVEMPGEILSARSGELQGNVTGNTASFEVIDVIKKPAPMVFKSRAINWMYLLGIVFLVVILALVAGVASRRKNNTKTEKQTKKGKKK